VADPSYITPGAWIRLHAADPGDNDATNALLGYQNGVAVGSSAKIMGSYGIVRLLTRVTAVKDDWV
jgi:hypothetical protein